MPSKTLPTLPAFMLNDDTDKDTDAALTTTHAIASVGIATLKMLETLLPVAAGEVERESRALAENITTLVKHITDNEIPSRQVSKTISKIIMGMQFQDRNTQIMDNVTCILERYRTMLEDVCSNISTIRDDQVQGGHTIAKAVEDILSGIRLSDIRTRYLDALRKARVSSHDGLPFSDTFDITGNEIELF